MGSDDLQQTPFAPAQQLGPQHIHLVNSLALDLQLPLTYMQNVLSLLRSGYYAKEDLPEHVASLQINAERLQTMVDGLMLALGASENPNQLELSPINVSSVLHDVHVGLNPLAHSYHCQLDYQISQSLVPVYAHRQSLKHVLNSLLDAMIQSTSSEVIEILAHHQNEHIMITLRDHGRTLLDSTLETILKRMGKAIVPSRQLPTSGLAIFVARSLLDSMSGSLHVQQRKDQRIVSVVLRQSEQLSLV